MILQRRELLERRFERKTKEARSIHRTTHYDMFKIHRLNRPIDQRHLKELIRNIEIKNLLPDKPIEVSSDYYVIDGQHRLAAARFLNLPIYYIKTVATVIDDAHHLNAVQKTWTTRDFLHRECEAGNSHYIALNNFMSRWPHISIRAAINLTSHRAGHANADVIGVFKSGKYVCTSLDFAEKVASGSFDFKQWVNFYKKSAFVMAITRCFQNPNYDHKRMLQKMEYCSVRLVDCSKTHEFLERLEEIYNWKVIAANKVWLTK